MPQKPKPFQRPGISLSLGLEPAPKAWKKIPAHLVGNGDIVQGHNRGWVIDSRVNSRIVSLHFKNGARETFALDDMLTVFTEDYSGVSK